MMLTLDQGIIHVVCVDIAMPVNGLQRAIMVTLSDWMKERMRIPANYFLDSQGVLRQWLYTQAIDCIKKMGAVFMTLPVDL